MFSDTITNILIVLNPISGDIEKDHVKILIQNYCQEHLVQFTFFSTTGKNDESNFKDLLTQNSPDLVVAMGGDGTVSMVAKILNHGSVPLAIIPLGSGNGLSKDLGIPQNVEEAIALLHTGRFRRIDSLEINGITAFHLGDLGFNARVVQLFHEGETRGPAAYAKIALQEYMSYTPFSYKISTDSEDFEGAAFMVTIANANAFGSNAAINPTGEIDDGVFEICLLEPFPATAAFGILYDLYNNSIQESVYSRILKCRKAIIFKEAGDVLQIDGEPILTGNAINISIHHKSLAVLVPNEISDN